MHSTDEHIYTELTQHNDDLGISEFTTLHMQLEGLNGGAGHLCAGHRLGHGGVGVHTGLSWILEEFYYMKHSIKISECKIVVNTVVVKCESRTSTGSELEVQLLLTEAQVLSRHEARQEDVDTLAYRERHGDHSICRRSAIQTANVICNSQQFKIK